MNPLISIIVPVYNVEEYLSKCLDSIVNQTYKNLEIILVDDGSTDNSGIICDKYSEGDGRIKVIHKENAGVVEARISGVNNSSANYIMFIDSDDFIDIEMIETMWNSMKHTNVDLVCCQYFDYYDEDTIIKSPVRPEIGLYNKGKIENLLKYNFLYDSRTGIAGYNLFLWTKIIKKDKVLQCLEKGKGLFYGEDQVSILCLLYNIDNMLILPDYLYYYRKRIGQATAKYKSNLWINMDLCFKKLIDIDRKNFLEYQIVPRSFSMYCMLINMLFKEKNYNYSINEIKKYKNLSFCQNLNRVNYGSLNLKKCLQYFFIKNEFWFLYYIFYKLNKIIKRWKINE